MPQNFTAAANSASRFILLGEDDQDDQEMLKEVFATLDQSIELFFVNNGKEVFSALESFADDRLPRLIVLDYNMPGPNGAEILAQLREIQRYHAIPRIVWSTSGSEKFKKSCLDMGALDYIIKPTSVQGLEQVARYMLSLCAK